MKSIIEQASSIVKAIEKAWNQAEQPKEFSIKIFEKEERNFFGMSTKPAKIGIFFGDKHSAPEKPVQKSRPEIKECRPVITKVPTNTPFPGKNSQEAPKISENPRKAVLDKSSDKPANVATQKKPVPSSPVAPKEKPHRIPTAWSEAMIRATHEWLTKTLQLMDMKSVSFTSEVAGKNLRITLSERLVEDAFREKQLFRSFAHLIISSLRNQYKQEIKDLKVILISTAHLASSHTATTHRDI